MSRVKDSTGGPETQLITEFATLQSTGENPRKKIDSKVGAGISP